MSLPTEWKWPFQCCECGQAFPVRGFPHVCPQCGCLFERNDEWIYDPQKKDSLAPGIDQYRYSFPLPPQVDFISLGEGNTPLVQVEHKGRRLYLKCEHLNPTGSFKDRGTAILVSALKVAGIEVAVEDSSGNAGASFAAYAAYAGIQAKIFIPAYASGPKRRQIEAYGAEVIPVSGPRSAATQAVMEEVDRGATYASHAYLPHGIAGMATVAYELVEQLGDEPRTIITPVGQGSLLLGLAQGFQALLIAAAISNLPRLVAVQSKVCAPIWAEFQGIPFPSPSLTEGDTIAEGIRILNPLRLKGVIEAISHTQGDAVAVEEDEIVAGQQGLAKKGFYVEPTAAVVWPGLLRLWDRIQDPVVLILTGNGLKSSNTHIA